MEGGKGREEKGGGAKGRGGRGEGKSGGGEERSDNDPMGHTLSSTFLTNTSMGG